MAVLVSVALSEEVCRWGHTLRFQKIMHVVPNVPFCFLLAEDMSSQLLLWLCLCAPIMGYNR